MTHGPRNRASKGDASNPHHESGSHSSWMEHQAGTKSHHHQAIYQLWGSYLAFPFLLWLWQMSRESSRQLLNKSDTLLSDSFVCTCTQGLSHLSDPQYQGRTSIPPVGSLNLKYVKFGQSPHNYPVVIALAHCKPPRSLNAWLSTWPGDEGWQDINQFQMTKHCPCLATASKESAWRCGVLASVLLLNNCTRARLAKMTWPRSYVVYKVWGWSPCFVLNSAVGPSIWPKHAYLIQVWSGINGSMLS